MAAPDRFSPVAPLPPVGGWRRAVAVELGSGAPRPVVLSFVPPGVSDDPERLAAVVRDVEAAGRLHHPGAVSVLGIETLGEVLAVVEPFRTGTTLRAILDAGGRLPPDVAARVVLDACAAIARAHAIDAGDGRRLVHGALDASRILLGDDGAALVCGFGSAGDDHPGADVRALAAVLQECLSGEPPGDPPRPLELPGVPAALAEAARRVLTPSPAEPSPGALAEAIAGAGVLASHEAVAAYVDAILPPDEGARAELRRAVERAVAGAGAAEELSAEIAVEPTDPARAPRASPRPAPLPRAPRAEARPEPVGQELPRPPATRPGVDPVGVFRAPGPPPAASRVPLLVAAVCAIAGLAIGLALARGSLRLREPERAALPAPERAALPAPPIVAGESAPLPAVVLDAPAGHAVPATRAPPAAPTPPPTRVRPGASTRVGTGFLAITAPDDAEVFLDGRRIGMGFVHVEVPEGPHRVEVRRGEARVAERFTLARGETWIYEATPTP